MVPCRLSSPKVGKRAVGAALDPPAGHVRPSRRIVPEHGGGARHDSPARSDSARGWKDGRDV
jgi:hypothetical protein